MELSAARKEGFVPRKLSSSDGKQPTKKILSVIGVMTTFGRKKNRDAIRKAWMPSGTFFICLVHLARPMRFRVLSFIQWKSCYVHKDFRVGLGFVVWFLITEIIS
jgi:hypothetical protein